MCFRRCKIQLFLPLPSCFPTLLQLPPPISKRWRYHRTRWRERTARTAEELYFRELGKKSFWWPWKFKCACFNSSDYLLKFFITLINCVWASAFSLLFYSPLCTFKSFSKMFFFPWVTKNDAQKAVKMSDCLSLITNAICGFIPRLHLKTYCSRWTFSVDHHTSAHSCVTFSSSFHVSGFQRTFCHFTESNTGRDECKSAADKWARAPDFCTLFSLILLS